MKNKMRPAVVEAFERQIISQGEAVVNSWKTYLDAPAAPAIESASDRYVMAKMLDTAQRELKALEATQTTSVFGTAYLKSLLGMTRQVFPRLFGTQLVAVQPMDRPTGQIFHLAVTRDDGSSLGARPQDDVSGRDSAALLASRTYGDAGTQGSQNAGEGITITTGMKLGITSSAVEIGNAKKLKTEATMELVQDLNAYHGINALDLLQGAAVDEIAQEIDAMLVKAVYDAAVAHKTVTFGAVAPSGWTQKDWNHELPKALIRADRAIAKASLRRPNVVVVGFEAYEYLLNLNSFTLNPNADWDAGNMALQQVGTLSGQYNVFMSRFVPDREILIGRKGAGFLDAGVVYAPYVPLFVSDRVFDITTQKTAQSFASRFGIFTMANHLYARVVIDPASSAGIV